MPPTSTWPASIHPSNVHRARKPPPEPPAADLLPVDYLRQMLYTDEDSFEYPQGGGGGSANYGTGEVVGGATSANMPQCPHCHRFYVTRLKLKAHIQKYCLKEKKYKCMFCIYRSKRRDHIRRHMLKVHAAQTNKRLALGLPIEIDESMGAGELGADGADGADGTLDDLAGDHVTGDQQLTVSTGGGPEAKVSAAVMAAVLAAAAGRKDNRSEGKALAAGADGPVSAAVMAAVLAAASAGDGSASGADDDGEDDNDYDDGDDDDDEDADADGVE